MLMVSVNAKSQVINENGVYLYKTDSNIISVLAVVGYHNVIPYKAHYVEHLTWFNSVGEASRGIDRQANAWTNKHTMMYLVTGRKEELLESINLLSRIFDPIALPNEFAQEEKDIIIREYESIFTGNKNAKIYEELDAYLYKDNVLAYSIIGTPDIIENLDFEEAIQIHFDTHKPENTRLLITGNLERQEVDQIFSHSNWPRMDLRNNELKRNEFSLLANESSEFIFTQKNNNRALFWRKIIRLDSQVEYELLNLKSLLLAEILNSSLEGSLAGPLHFNQAIARTFQLHIMPIDEKHLEVSVLLQPDRNITLRRLEHALIQELSHITKTRIPEKTFDRILNRFSRRFPDWKNQVETQNWMAEYAFSRLTLWREPRSKTELQSIQNQLTTESINDLLKQLSGEGRVVIGFVNIEDDQ